MKRLSVTEVLKLSGLVDTTYYTAEGRDRGRAVHRATELIDEGDLDEQWLQSTDDVTRTRVNSYKRFLHETGSTVLRTEFEVIHPALDYVGHPDRLMLIKGKEAIVDIKPPVHQRWYALQLAAYKRALEALWMGEDKPPVARYVLHLGCPGPSPYRLVPCTDINDWYVFHAALILTRWKEAGS